MKYLSKIRKLLRWRLDNKKRKLCITENGEEVKNYRNLKVQSVCFGCVVATYFNYLVRDVSLAGLRRFLQLCFSGTLKNVLLRKLM